MHVKDLVKNMSIEGFLKLIMMVMTSLMFEFIYFKEKITSKQCKQSHC